MKNNIFVNANLPFQTRVAVVEENGTISRFFVQNGSTLNLSMYKAKVGKWQPNLQAFFVDFGAVKAGFLPKTNCLVQKAPNEGGLKEGDWINVQILDENPGWNKGAKLTQQISLVSNLVAMKTDTTDSMNFPDYTKSEFKSAILKAINADETSQETSETKPQDDKQDNEPAIKYRVNFKGLYQTRDAQAVIAEYNDLKATFKNIENYSKGLSTTGLIYSGNNLIDRILDLRKSNTQSIYTDYEVVHNALFVRLLLENQNKTKMLIQHTNPLPIFESHNISSNIGLEIENRNIDLPSGGSISIDKTEAMTAIDINSGKGSSSEKTAGSMVVRVNLESAETIVREIKRRDIGGLIVIDFIDMNNEKDKEQVNNLMKNLLLDEKKTLVLPISEIGLMQIARPKFNTNDNQEPLVCEHCSGTGIGLSAMQGCMTIVRLIEKYLYKQSNGKEFNQNINKIYANVPEYFADKLLNEYRDICVGFEQYYSVRLIIVSDPTCRHINDITLNVGKQQNILENYKLTYIDKNILPFDVQEHLKGGYDSKRSFENAAATTHITKKTNKKTTKTENMFEKILSSLLAIFTPKTKSTVSKKKKNNQSDKKNPKKNRQNSHNTEKNQNKSKQRDKNSSKQQSDSNKNRKDSSKQTNPSKNSTKNLSDKKNNSEASNNMQTLSAHGVKVNSTESIVDPKVNVKQMVKQTNAVTNGKNPKNAAKQNNEKMFASAPAAPAKAASTLQFKMPKTETKLPRQTKSEKPLTPTTTESKATLKIQTVTPGIGKPKNEKPAIKLNESQDNNETAVKPKVAVSTVKLKTKETAE